MSTSYKSSALAEMGDRVTAEWAEKWGGLLYPFPWGKTGSPSNTMSPRPRPTSVPSGILIRPTVWLQYTNVTHKQDRQTGHRSDRANLFANARPKITLSDVCQSTFWELSYVEQVRCLFPEVPLP